MGPIVLLLADERGNPADVTGGPSLTLNGPRRCSRMYEIQEFCTAQGYFEPRPPAME